MIAAEAVLGATGNKMLQSHGCGCVAALGWDILIAIWDAKVEILVKRSGLDGEGLNGNSRAIGGKPCRYDF
jgi:hypothetical protein